MSYDDWLTTDTSGDEAEGRSRLRLRLEHDEREERWAQFTDWCRLEIMQHGVAKLLLEVGLASLAQCAHLEPTRTEREILHFAETEQFSGVLSALAHAVKAEEHS